MEMVLFELAELDGTMAYGLSVNAAADDMVRYVDQAWLDVR